MARVEEAESGCGGRVEGEAGGDHKRGDRGAGVLCAFTHITNRIRCVHSVAAPDDTCCGHERTARKQGKCGAAEGVAAY